MLATLSRRLGHWLYLCILQYDHRTSDDKAAARVQHSEVMGEDAAAAVKKSDDRALLNWDSKVSKMAKGMLPNLEGFNQTDYIRTGHRDSNSYKLNAFNQEESDKLPSDRSIPDTRNYR